jgi:protein involved in polysaccharide export with SLBB domain
VETKPEDIKLDSTGKMILDSAAVKKKKIIDEPVSIDLYMAMQNPNSKYDIVLQDGDVVVVPEINPFVSIQGRVQSPLKIAFDKEHTKLSYYIDKAGGYGVKPWRKRIYVTYANGKSQRTKSFLFFRFYPRVKEGSIITVPERPEGAVVSDLAKSTIVAAVPVVLTALIIRFTN